MAYLPQVKIISYTTPLSGIVDNQFPMTGTLRTIGSGVIADVVTDFPVSNQHLFILVNSITTGGDIVITGTSLSESTAVPVVGDTETITIDTSTGQYYQSNKKWWEVTNIDISSGTIAVINYDYGVVGYPDLGNRDFKILGYRMDAYSQNDSVDFRLLIQKVQDDGNKKMSIVHMENFGLDSGGVNQLIDDVRSGGDDRSYAPSVANVVLNNTVVTLKQLDFDSYFTNDENIIEAENNNEGYIIRIAGAPAGGITGVDFISLLLYYKLL